MAALQCEICGGKLIGKPGGIFECDSCGTEYSTEWASAKIQEIKGTIKVEGTVQVAGTVTIEGGISAASLLKRGELALEDREWDNARKAYDRALDISPENGEAYFGKLLAEYHVRNAEELSTLSWEFTSSANYQKALRFADKALAQKLENVVRIIEEREEAQRREKARQAELARKQAEENRKKAQKKARNAAHAAKIALPILAAAIALVVLVNTVVLPMLTKKPQPETPVATEAQMEAPATEAQSTEETAPSAEEIQYSQAEAWEADGQLGRAAIAFGKLGDYKDARERSFAIWEKIIPRQTLTRTHAIQNDGTIELHLNGYFSWLTQDEALQWTDIVEVHGAFGLKSDGTLLSSGKVEATELNVSEWTDIVDVAAGNSSYRIKISSTGSESLFKSFILGQKSDGTVVAVGDNVTGQCDVANWTNIVSIITDAYELERVHLEYGVAVNLKNHYTVGLKYDGTLVVAGKPPEDWDLSDWTDIVKIDTAGMDMVGLKRDGTVISTREDVSGWNQIIDVNIGEYHILGLRADGTVVAVGNERMYNHLAVDDWTDIVAIDSGGMHTVGLKLDGTVVAVGYNKDGQCDVSDWSNIVAIWTEYENTIGLKSDGTAVLVGWKAGEYFNYLSDFSNIKIPTKPLPARNGNETKPEKSPTDQQAQYDAAEKVFADGETAKAGDKEQRGTGEPAYIGVEVTDAPEDYVEQYGYRGALVGIVEQGTAVQTAGIQPQDLIIRLEDYEIGNATDLVRAVRNFQAGETAVIVVLRRGEELKLQITFGEKP